MLPPPGGARPGHAPAVDEAAKARALRWVRIFGLTLVVALGLGLVSLPWPWLLLPGLLCVVALVVGIVALVKVRTAKVRGSVTPVLVVGLVLAAFMSLAASGQVVLWREYGAYSECMAGAITEQAKDSCVAQLQRSLDDRMQQVLEEARQQAQGG
jgi:uncharacterized membrane protein